MRWYLGYPVLAVGLAFGANAFLPSSAEFAPPPHASLPAPTVISAEDAGLEAAVPSRLAAFSPGARLLMAAIPDRSVFSYFRNSEAAALSEAPTATVHLETTSWTSVVVTEPAVMSAGAEEAQRTAWTERVALARAIQRELRRVGCYGGRIDGSWGSGSKRAIHTFLDRVNASLPSEEPDVFMLSLVSGQTEPVCGSECPHGQSLSAGGRCLPTIMARTETGKQRHAVELPSGQQPAPTPPAPALVREGWEPVVTAALPSRRAPAFEGRMSIGAALPEDDLLPNGRVRAAPVQRTAALETAALAEEGASDGEAAGFTDPNEPELEALPVVAEPLPRPKAAASPTRRVKAGDRSNRTRKTYRHVQKLFVHPLGRM